MFLVIREKTDNDIPALSDVIRRGYLSNVSKTFRNSFFHEATFQVIILTMAASFICFGIPWYLCIATVPLLCFVLYIAIKITLLMKAVQITYEKKPLKCWVAEAYEPYMFTSEPRHCWYKIVTENELEEHNLPEKKFKKKLIGTISCMKHLGNNNWAWLYGLVVNEGYRRKGVALSLIEVLVTWCKNNRFENIELALSECQDAERELFNEAGFELSQVYHKPLCTSYIALGMCQLRFQIRHND